MPTCQDSLPGNCSRYTKSLPQTRQSKQSAILSSLSRVPSSPAFLSREASHTGQLSRKPNHIKLWLCPGTLTAASLSLHLPRDASDLVWFSSLTELLFDEPAYYCRHTDATFGSTPCCHCYICCCRCTLLLLLLFLLVVRGLLVTVHRFRFCRVKHGDDWLLCPMSCCCCCCCCCCCLAVALSQLQYPVAFNVTFLYLYTGPKP